MLKRLINYDSDDWTLIGWLFVSGLKYFVLSSYKEGLRAGWRDLTDCWGFMSFHLRNDVSKE